jgi:hypothetical protein
VFDVISKYTTCCAPEDLPQLAVSQNNPVELVQVLAPPQVQLVGFSETPLVKPHGATLLHLFTDAVQNSPVDDVQSLVPQVHAFKLPGDPS